MNSLLIPMAFMVFYIVGIGIFTLRTRFKAVAQKQVHPKYFKTYDTSQGIPPEYLVRVGRHFDNQLQAPVVFLITLQVCLQIGLTTTPVVLAAWVFIATRVLHTIIHLGTNHVLKRAGSYFAGWIVILVIWTMILIQTHLQ